MPPLKEMPPFKQKIPPCNFFGFSRVLLIFQAFGVKPVAHIIMKSMCMVSWISVGSIRRSSFTIPLLGPGDLLLLRVLIHSLNALLSSKEECSQFLYLVPSDSSCNLEFSHVKQASHILIRTS
jgi:hypothetical protein